MVTLDAVVVGAGPNGLTAAITLAQAGLAVQLHEAAEGVGGGARTEELTLPGFRHDSCSAVHPLAAGSPALRALPLDRYGLRWVQPELALAHPFPDGSAALLAQSPQTTARSLGGDAEAYRRLVEPFVDHWDELAREVLRAPLVAWPRDPFLLGRFALSAIQPASLIVRRFREERARTLIAGLAAHVMAPPTTPATGGVALLFALAAHTVGWPFPRGGSQALSDALAAHLRSLGATIRTGHRVHRLEDLPDARIYLFDVSPRELAAIAGSRLPGRYLRGLNRYRYGLAAFKVDYALAEPVPWKAEICRRAGTVHLGASFGEIDAALRAARAGRAPQPPFLITAQPSLFDPTRAPQGKHVFWAYAHVPGGWRGDLTAAIDRQIERFAPGFRDLVLARAIAGPAQIQSRNPNNVEGDIACGSFQGRQIFFRPTVAITPYATPDPTIYLCSSATPPGPGVHGMCGYHAARIALRRVFGVRIPATERS
jgi:phytoene dehydrogenase-like protein